MPIHDLPVLSVGLAPHHHVEAHDSAFCGLDAHHGHGDSASTSFCGANSSAAAKPSSFCAGSSNKPTSFVHNHHDPAIKETSFNEVRQVFFNLLQSIFDVLIFNFVS